MFLGAEGDTGQEGSGDGSEDHWEGEGWVSGPGGGRGQARVYQAPQLAQVVDSGNYRSLDTSFTSKQG